MIFFLSNNKIYLNHACIYSSIEHLFHKKNLISWLEPEAPHCRNMHIIWNIYRIHGFQFVNKITRTLGLFIALFVNLHLLYRLRYREKLLRCVNKSEILIKIDDYTYVCIKFKWINFQAIFSSMKSRLERAPWLQHSHIA